MSYSENPDKQLIRIAIVEDDKTVREGLQMLLNGSPMSGEIASQLSISTETVRTHIRNIYEKLHVRTRSEAILKYLKK